MKRRMPLGLLIGLRVVLAAAAAALLVLEILLQIGVYKEPTWIPVTIVGVVATGALLTNLAGIFRAAKEGVRTRIYKACVGAAAFTADATRVPMVTIGVSVFKVKKRIGTVRRWWPLCIKNVLYRVERFRLTDLPQPSKVVWSEGKGAIGQCLKTRRWQYKDWSPVAARFQSSSTDQDFTDSDFDQLQDSERSGFDRDEFIGIVHKYAEILAVPVMSVGGSSIIGVVAIDRPYDPDHTSPVFRSPDVRTAAETAAVAIVDDLPKAPILDP